MATNYFAQPVPGLSSPDFCPSGASSFTKEELLTPFVNGISTSKFNPDSQTGRVPISELQARVRELEQANMVPVRKQIPGTTKTDMDDLIKKDSVFYNNVKLEYCYYEARYKWALRTFLEASTSLDSSQNARAREYLQISTQLNQLLNNLLEIVSYLTESRMDPIVAKKDTINNTNRQIGQRLSKLNNQQALLKRDNAIAETQKEMVKYTQEKNDHILNQISFFVVLNAAAIGAIFAIWRSSAGT